MNALAILGGALLVILVAWDAFESVVLPRRVLRPLRFARIAQRLLWRLWTAVARRIEKKGLQEDILALFGPFTVLVLLGTWAAGMVFGFALLQWGFGNGIGAGESGLGTGFGLTLYMSGTTFFTLGIGELYPTTGVARLITVVEVGTGFALLALVISYLPVLWQAFARREAPIVMLTMWAGSPSSAGLLLQRLGRHGNIADLPEFLQIWERWAADLVQSHLAYPVLAYYRSQHERQSWLTAMTAVLDVCALNLTCIEGANTWTARLTFSIAQHAAVNNCQVLGLQPSPVEGDRLPAADFDRLREILKEAGVEMAKGPRAEAHLAELRETYEPYVNALSLHLLADLPPWLPPEGADERALLLA